MALPFIPQSRKARWNLSANEKRIGSAIDEADVQEFEKDLRSLYPILEKYGMKMPLIEPAGIGEREYGNAWRGFHLRLLKALRRHITDGTFDLSQWNYDVEREEEQKREEGLVKELHEKYKLIGDGLWLLDPIPRGLEDYRAKMQRVEVEVLIEELTAQGLFLDPDKFPAGKAQDIAYELSAIAKHKGTKAAKKRLRELS